MTDLMRKDKEEAAEYLLKDMSKSEPHVLFSSETIDLNDDEYEGADEDGTRIRHRRSSSWVEEISPRTRYNLRQLIASSTGGPSTTSSSPVGRARLFPLRAMSSRRCYVPTIFILGLVLPSLLAVHQAPEGSTLETHPWTVKLKESYGSAKESIWALGAELQKGEEGGFGGARPEGEGDPRPDPMLDLDFDPDLASGPPSSSETSTDPPSLSHLTSSDIRLYQGVLELLTYLPLNWPIEPYLDGRQDTLDELGALKLCLEREDCKPGQKTVIVGGSFHFGNSQHGHVSGEDIWARSSVDAFKTLNHTMVYGYKPLENLAFHRALGEFIPIILMEAAEIFECIYSGIPRALSADDLKHLDGWDLVDDEEELMRLSEYHKLGIDPSRLDAEGNKLKWGWKWSDNGETGDLTPGCIRRRGFEDGLPLWKLLAFHFWGDSGHSLGPMWTMAPEDYASMGHGENHYLGYSLEKYCRQHAYVKAEDRKQQAFVYGKEEWYFEVGYLSWYNDNHTFTDLHASLGLDFVAAVGSAGSPLPDEGITNIGKQKIEGFYQAIGESLVTIGIGHPYLSPTPYDSLCLGVPFINPVIHYDPNARQDHTKWGTQQDGLNDIGEPYVYHVIEGDLVGFEEALRKAKENRIEVFIPPRMTTEANNLRHKLLVEAEWLALAEGVIGDARKRMVELETVLL